MARQLLLSVDHAPQADEDDLNNEWDEVVDRRPSEVLDGTATLIDGRDGLATIRDELAARGQ